MGVGAQLEGEGRVDFSELFAAALFNERPFERPYFLFPYPFDTVSACNGTSASWNSIKPQGAANYRSIGRVP